MRLIDILIFSLFFLAGLWISAGKGLVFFLLKSAVIFAFLILSRPSKKSRLNAASLVGIVLSFGAALLLQPVQIQMPNFVLWLSISCFLFYSVFLLASYFYLGRNLSVVPQLKTIVRHGTYGMVRHPIYAAYFYLAATWMLLSYSLFNLILFLALGLGLWLRIREEEELLKTSEDYQDYLKLRIPRIFSPVLVLPLVLLLVGVLYGQNVRSPKMLRAQMAYPVLNLNPLYYDDFGSVFVGNHIYPRLLDESDRMENLTVANYFDVQCILREGSNCKRYRVEIDFKKNLVNCRQEPLSVSSLKNEFFQILKRKTWIFPQSQPCKSGRDICLEGAGRPDLYRNFQALYFRFGWSLESFQTEPIGAGPYCLENQKVEGGEILSGRLVPKSRDLKLAEIEFFTGSSAEDEFDFAIYGNDSPGDHKRKNLVTSTPLAYYVVSNPKLNSGFLPWNSIEVREVIQSFLKERDLVFKEEALVSGQLPKGEAKKFSLKEMPKKSLNEYLMLPSYLTDCSVLEDSINSVAGKEIAICGNTSALIEAVQKREASSWGGFFTPLTPGAPSRSAIEQQYFSIDSDESWTYPENDGSPYFYLSGVGKTFVTVDASKICHLQVNPMGVGDLLVSDFVFCR